MNTNSVSLVALTLPNYPLQRRYRLAYGYRLVNTKHVDEYVEEVTITSQVARQGDSFVWKFTYQPERIDYVGSPEAMQFFQWHQQQSSQQQQYQVLTDKHGYGQPAELEQAHSSISRGHLAFLTPGIWSNGELVYQRERVLPHYFGLLDLPVLETMHTEVLDMNSQVRITGQLFADHFDQARFSRFVKEMTDIYDLRTRIDLTHEGRYLIDEQGLILNAEVYTEAEVGGAYNVTMARTLTQLAEQ